MKEANIRDSTPALIADISIRGLWQPQAVALRVVDTDAPLHIHRNTVAVLSSAEKEKKRKYNSAVHVKQLLPLLLYLPILCWVERRISY